MKRSSGARRDPALVEWMGQGLLRTRIFPIAPGERRPSSCASGRLPEARRPMALRIDYRPPCGAASSGAQHVRTALPGAPRVWPGLLAHARLACRGKRRPARGECRRRAQRRERAGTVGAHRLLRLGARADACDGGEDGFAMITIAPPAARAAPPRATSPSCWTCRDRCAGRSWSRPPPRAGPAGSLNSFRPLSRHRILHRRPGLPRGVECGNAGQRALGPAVPARPDRRGSTNISGALEQALQASPAAGRLPLVLFLTDGAPTVGERQPDRITALAARLRGRQRLFTFGVGTDVNASLLEATGAQRPRDGAVRPSRRGRGTRGGRGGPAPHPSSATDCACASMACVWTGCSRRVTWTSSRARN